jgi:hypothetical protein
VFDIPTDFPAPSLVSTDAGYVTATSNGIIGDAVIEGRRVTITVDTLDATTRGTINITYGNGTVKLTGPSGNKTWFRFYSDPSGTNVAPVPWPVELDFYTPTFTATPVSTITPTPTAFLLNIKNASFLGWWYDMAGNTNQAIYYYYQKASACAGRNDKVGQVQGVYSAGHSLVRKFNSSSQYNQNLKRIRLILAPSAQATAGALYADTLTTAYTSMLDTAEAHLDYAASITGTSKAASDTSNTKIKIDLDLITAIRLWITNHL